MAKSKGINLSECPTCLSKRTEIAPGQWIWPNSTYRLDGEEHPCDCERQDDLRRHYLLAGIPLHYWVLGENDWIGDKDALAATKEYLANWKAWKRYGIGLQFYSPNQGTGKTMLACLIGKELIKRKVKVKFITFLDAMSVYQLPMEDRLEVEKQLRDVPVLIFDEVGKSFSNAQHAYFAAELESLIRFRSDGNGVTIITTNLTPEELDEEYPRTFSLLASKQEYVYVKGQDARKERDWNEYHKYLIKLGEARPIT